MKKLNTNVIIKVRLNDFGKDIYYHQYDDLLREYPGIGIEPSFPKVDEDGFTSFQLRQFMELYGEYFVMGRKLPIEDNNIYLDEKDLDICDG